MEIKSSLLRVRLSVQKTRMIINLIRGKIINCAIKILTFNLKKTSLIIKKFLKTAIANAKHNFKINVNNFIIKKIHVEKGRVFKRFMARAKGKGDNISKQSCHIYLILKKH